MGPRCHTRPSSKKVNRYERCRERENCTQANIHQKHTSEIKNVSTVCELHTQNCLPFFSSEWRIVRVIERGRVGTRTQPPTPSHPRQATHRSTTHVTRAEPRNSPGVTLYAFRVNQTSWWIFENPGGCLQGTLFDVRGKWWLGSTPVTRQVDSVIGKLY